MKTKDRLGTDLLLVRCALAAFLRDTLKPEHQLCWYFNGRCVGYLAAQTLPLSECRARAKDQLQSSGRLRKLGWRGWNMGLGTMDALMESSAYASSIHRNDNRTVVSGTDTSTNRVLEQESERLLNATLEGRLRCAPRSLFAAYFEAKIDVLERCTDDSVSSLCDELFWARDRATSARCDHRLRFSFAGRASALAELAALKRAVQASHS